jgi:predicted nucleic acid-binding protein
VTVLDASALIAFLDPSDALHPDAVSRLLALEAPRLLVSPITHAEILVGPARAGTVAATQAALGLLGVSEVALAQDAAPRLAELGVTTGLKLPDCGVILAAQQSENAAILSFDERLLAAAGRLGLLAR